MVLPTPAAPPAVPRSAVAVLSEDSVVSLEAAAAAAAVWSPSVEYPANRNLEPLNRRGFLESCSCHRASMFASTCRERGAQTKRRGEERRKTITTINQSIVSHPRCAASKNSLARACGSRHAEPVQALPPICGFE